MPESTRMSIVIVDGVRKIKRREGKGFWSFDRIYDIHPPKTPEPIKEAED